MMDIDMDFAAVLLIAGVVSGLIWLVDSWLFESKRKRDAMQAQAPVKRPVLVEFSRSLFPVIVVVLLLRSFVVEPFRIPSGSMLPTLFVGDFIVVNKFTYGLRLPVIHTKFLELGTPKRGDVIVFRHPKDNVDYIKRVVGVPGDVVSYRNKQLTINGKEALYEEMDVFLEQGRVLTQLKETLHHDEKNAFSHAVILDKNLPAAPPQEWTVPQMHYFVMGDNRDNSNDSRFWGMVAEESLVGKAFGIWMNWNTEQGFFPINVGRIGHKIE